MIYDSLIQSHLSYLVTCWGSTNHNAINRLQILQNRAIRNVYHLNYLHNRCNMYTEHKKLPIRGNCLLQTAVMVYSPHHNLNHNSLTLVKRKNSRHGLLFYQTHSANNYGTKCITCFGPRVFNFLPENIRNRNSLGAFKRDLINFLINPSTIPKLFEKRFLNITLPY